MSDYSKDPYELFFCAEDGEDFDLDDIIKVEENPASYFKYVAWFGKWPCDIEGNDPEKVKEVAWDSADIILKQIEGNLFNGNNFGLAYYACGYDGKAQTEFVKHYADEFGVEVF